MNSRKEAKRRAMYKLAVTRLGTIRMLADVEPGVKKQVSLETVYAVIDAIKIELGQFVRDVHAMGERE
jgi:hypothetical protein